MTRKKKPRNDEKEKASERREGKDLGVTRGKNPPNDRKEKASP
jgi:hypothetical protein